MLTLDETIADLESGLCVHETAVYYLKRLKKYEEAEKGRATVFGKRLNENVAVLPEGVYCNVCGTRLDLDEVNDDTR